MDLSTVLLFVLFRPPFVLLTKPLRPPQPSSHLFYPSRLATTLTSSAPPLVSSRHSNEELGFIVLETNYKLYAYTSNPLQIAVLGLFAQLKTRFANFVTGMITRDSVRRGLGNGITANQVRSCCISLPPLVLLRERY
jgi:transcription initiation factor TFIIH subunit 4